MHIRTAQAGDEQHIADVIINTWKIAYRGIVPDCFLDSLTTEKHKKLFRENIANKAETIFVLENNNKQIVGVVSGGVDRLGIYDCELVAIYILSDYQKRGYGKLLFKKLIEEYKRNSFKSMIIWTFKDNKDRKFYEIFGGTIGEKKNYNFGGSDVAIVAYTWRDINKIDL